MLASTSFASVELSKSVQLSWVTYLTYLLIYFNLINLNFFDIDVTKIMIIEMKSTSTRRVE